MSTSFEPYIKEIKEAFLNREIPTIAKKLEVASEAMSNFTEEEIDKNSTLIGQFHRLSMSFQQNFVENQSSDDTYKDLLFHLRALEELGLAEVDDYLRFSANADRFSLPLFETVLLNHPEHPQLIRDLGKYYLQKQAYEEAWICLKKATDICPADVSIKALLYECCHQYAEHLEGGETVAAAEVEKILMLYTEIHDGYSSLEVLNSSLAEEISDTVKENYLAIAYFRTSNSQEALNHWHKLYNEEALSEKNVIAYAEFEINNHNKEVAIDLLESRKSYSKPDFSKVKNLDDLLTVWQKGCSNSLCDALHSYALLGNIHCQFDKTEKAEELLKAGLALKPDDTDLLLKLAKVYVRQENMDEAVVQLNLARKAGLHNSTYLLEMADIYFRIAEWNQTLTLINQYHSIDLATPLSTYLGGVAASHVGDKSAAYHLLSSCITDFQLHYYVQEATYQRARLSRSVFRFKEALEDVEGALRYMEKKGELHRKFQLLRGDLLFNLGKYEHSFDCLSQAQQQSPLTGQPLLYLQFLIRADFAKGKDIPDTIPALTDESIIPHPKDALDYVYNAKVYIILKQHLNSAESFAAAAEAGYLPESHYIKAFNMAYEAEAFSYVINLYEIMKEKFILDFNTTANYAFALYKSERYEETIPAYEDMAYRYPEMMDTPERRKIWSHTIAHCYQMLGKYEEAIQYYSILLSGMKPYDRGFLKRLQEIGEQRPDKDDFSRYSLLQYMKFANVALNEEEEKSLEALDRQMKEKRYSL